MSSRYQGTLSSFVDPSGLQRAHHNILNKRRLWSIKSLHRFFTREIVTIHATVTALHWPTYHHITNLQEVLNAVPYII
jgi:hypothetical protein